MLKIDIFLLYVFQIPLFPIKKPVIFSCLMLFINYDKKRKLKPDGQVEGIYLKKRGENRCSRLLFIQEEYPHRQVSEQLWRVTPCLPLLQSGNGSIVRFPDLHK